MTSSHESKSIEDNFDVMNESALFLFTNGTQKGSHVNKNENDLGIGTKYIIEYTLMSFIIVCGTVGNICVIRMFGFTKRRHHAGSALVVTLAVNDFLSSIFIPIDALFWITFLMRIEKGNFLSYPFGKAMCYMLKSANPLFMMASSWLMAAISIERLR